MKIETNYNTMWSAWNAEADADENRITGHGATEREAINDLARALLECEYAHGYEACEKEACDRISEAVTERDELREALNWAMQQTAAPTLVRGQNDGYFAAWHRANKLRERSAIAPYYGIEKEDISK